MVFPCLGPLCTWWSVIVFLWFAAGQQAGSTQGETRVCATKTSWYSFCPAGIACKIWLLWGLTFLIAFAKCCGLCDGQRKSWTYRPFMRNSGQWFQGLPAKENCVFCFCLVRCTGLRAINYNGPFSPCMRCTLCFLLPMALYNAGPYVWSQRSCWRRDRSFGWRDALSMGACLWRVLMLVL